MYASTHFAVGAIVGALHARYAPRPKWKFKFLLLYVVLTAAVLGIFTHWIDTVAHSEYDGLYIFDLGLYPILIFEFFALFYLIIRVGFIERNALWNASVLFGAFFGGVPDMILMASGWSERLGVAVPIFIQQFNLVHNNVHTPFPPLSLLIGVPIQLVLIFSALNFLNILRNKSRQ